MIGKNGIVRMMQRLTLREQLDIRKLPNTPENQKIFKQYRGSPLALRVLTKGEHILRAETVMKIMVGASSEAEAVKALQVRMKEVDVMCRAPEAIPVVDLITLPQNQLITIQAGKYERLGDGEKIPRHSVTLTRDHVLFPLTVGFLGQFSSANYARKILDGIYSKQKKEHELAGGISILGALELARLINSSLIGDIRLRLPAEPVLSVFFQGEEFAGNPAKNGTHLLTASQYNQDVVDAKTVEIELNGNSTGKEDRFVYRYAGRWDGKQHLGRWYVHPHSSMNSHVLFEVVPA